MHYQRTIRLKRNVAESETCWAVLPAAAIVLACLCAYSNSFDAPFIFDDVGAIVDNATIRYLSSIGTVLFNPTFASVAGRPILNLSFAINYAFGGIQVWGYHAVNLISHILAALALFGVIGRTLLLPSVDMQLGASASRLAMVITLLWAVHPLQTESVTYIVQRGEAMVGCLYLFSLYCFIRSIDSSKSTRWRVLAVVSCIVGMCTKEVMVTAPVVIMLFDWAFISGSMRQSLRRHGWFFSSLAATWLILATLMSTSGKREGTAGFGLGMGVWEYARLQPGFILHYLRLCFWPDPLVLDYGMNTTRSTIQVVPEIIAVVGLAGLTIWALFSKHRQMGFLGLCFFAILSPTSSIVPLPGQVAAEHRMYLPMAAVVIFVVLCVRNYLSVLTLRRRVLVSSVLIGLTTTALTLRTLHRNNDYREPLRIWLQVVRAVPNNARGYTSLGASLFEAGKFAESIRASNQAIDLEPRDPISYYNRGTAEQVMGNLDDGIADFSRTIELMPRNASAYINRGAALQQLGQREAAMQDFSKAIELQPNAAQAYYNLGALRQLEGNLDEAMTNYSRAIELRPDYINAYNNRGLIYQSMRLLDLATRDFDKAIQLNPRYAASYGNRGAVRLMTGQFEAAIEDFTQSIALNPTGTGSYANRAVAYYYVKSYSQAWADVAKAKSLGIQMDPKFIQNLSKDSGRIE